MLVAFNRFFFAGSGGCAVLLAGWQKTPIGGLAAWVKHGIRGPLGAFLSLFALRRSFSSFSATSRCFERPHSRVFCQPGKKTLQRGPLVAFSAAELLFAWVDLARVLSVGPLAHPGPRADWRLCWSRVRGCLSLRASLLIRFAFRLIRLANLLNARSV